MGAIKLGSKPGVAAYAITINATYGEKKGRFTTWLTANDPVTTRGGLRFSDKSVVLTGSSYRGEDGERLALLGNRTAGTYMRLDQSTNMLQRFEVSRGRATFSASQLVEKGVDFMGSMYELLAQSNGHPPTGTVYMLSRHPKSLLYRYDIQLTSWDYRLYGAPSFSPPRTHAGPEREQPIFSVVRVKKQATVPAVLMTGKGRPPQSFFEDCWVVNSDGSIVSIWVGWGDFGDSNGSSYQVPISEAEVAQARVRAIAQFGTFMAAFERLPKRD
jgi:hypothetical protein